MHYIYVKSIQYFYIIFTPNCKDLAILGFPTGKKKKKKKKKKKTLQKPCKTIKTATRMLPGYDSGMNEHPFWQYEYLIPPSMQMCATLAVID